MVTANKSGIQYVESIQLVTIQCGVCNIMFAMPDSLDRRARENHSIFFWCPNGDKVHYLGKTTVEELREKLEKEARDNAYWRSRTASAEGEAERNANSLRTTKGHLTRLKNRAERGVCIHCNRSFASLSRHMESKHGVENGHHDGAPK